MKVKRKLLSNGLVKLYLHNHRTNQIDHIYSRFEVVEGQLTREEEVEMHREAIFDKIRRQIDDYLPVMELPTKPDTYIDIDTGQRLE